MRRIALSRYNEIDAGDDLGILLMPFLAILHVGGSFYFDLFNI